MMDECSRGLLTLRLLQSRIVKSLSRTVNLHWLMSKNNSKLLFQIYDFALIESQPEHSETLIDIMNNANLI